jgi:hypothetical protein
MTLEEAFELLLSTQNEEIKVMRDRWSEKGGLGWEVCIGDCNTQRDYWQEQPYAIVFEIDLIEAITKAVEQYNLSVREHVLKQMAK